MIHRRVLLITLGALLIPMTSHSNGDFHRRLMEPIKEAIADCAEGKPEEAIYLCKAEAIRSLSQIARTLVKDL